MRAIGPRTEMSRPGGIGWSLCWPWVPRPGTTRKVDLCPNSPQCDAGTRIEPPMSLPISTGVKAAARAAEDPPDEPPGVRVRSQGLFVVPCLSLSAR